MKKQNPGKKFEEDFLKSIPSNIFKLRLKDDTFHFKNVNNPADIIIYYKGKLFVLELKSTKGKSLPYANIKENQFEGLNKISSVEGVIPGFLINFRSVEETYFLGIEQALSYKKREDKKSFPLEFIRQNGILIKCKKKRVRFTYIIEDFLNNFI